MVRKKSRNQIYRYFLTIVFVGVVSCKREGVYLYDKTGTLPDKNYSYTPPYPKAYIPYNRPYSRAYQNPYNLPPQNYYPYYDSDQYYVPPKYYNGIEPDSGRVIDPNMKY